jgi:curved DNA-binding protein
VPNGFDNFEFGQYGSFDDFINNLLGRMGGGAAGPAGNSRSYAPGYGGGYGTPQSGGFSGGAGPNLDVEANLSLTLGEAFAGVRKTLTVNGESFDVRIPPGARQGTKIRVRGKGNLSPLYTTQRGDLYLNVQLQPHNFFQIEGDNLTCEVAIAPDEAALGASIEVPTPDGTVSVTIPAGIRSGQSLRLRGKGWRNAKGDRGDQMVKVLITVPKTLGDRERELYEQLKAARGSDPRANLKSVTL